MCSILGYTGTLMSMEEITRFNNLMIHRGPDNSTVKKYQFKNVPLFFGHNRLAIQDLDKNANQPFENDRYSMVFNGEIYNHQEIRRKLEYSNFLTYSDTETILWAITEKGLSAINEFIGMFAIALFDKKENKIYLIRDRVGIKPLYWTFQNQEFAFSSELKGIPNHLKNNTSKKATIQFFSLGYIPNNMSYYENIYKLNAGHILVYDGESVKIDKYWELSETKINCTYEEALEETERLIKSSINYRLLADVNVGCFLSGGVDSSLVSSIMSKLASDKIKTFSIGFENKDYDESVYAKDIANHLDTEHYEYRFSANDVLSIIDEFDYFYDEPFGDASSLPMMLLSKVTKNEVTVALSGDGGDELFLGYDRYFITEKYFDLFSKIPFFLRWFASKGSQYSNIDKLEKISYPLLNLSYENLYSVLNTSIKPWEIKNFFSKEFLNDEVDNSFSFLSLQELSTNFNSKNDFSKVDFLRYLPDDILTKVDRASMAHSLEARVPLLDHRLVEFAYSLDENIKLKNGSKSLLKEILYKYVPRELVDRPKKGFAVPLKLWFKNELKDVLYEKIDSLDERFNKNYIRKIANLHIKDNRNYEYVLWNIMRMK